MTIEIDIGSLFQTVGLIILAIFILVSIFLMFRGLKRWFRSFKYDRTDLNSMRRRWTEIKAMADSPNEVNRKLAIMEADKLLDMSLKNLYMAGDTLGERLKFAAHKYPQIRKVWWAHKIRNQLAHEATFYLEPGIAKRAMRDFEATLKDLGAI